MTDSPCPCRYQEDVGILFCPLHSAAADLLDVVGVLTQDGPREKNGDWACRECKPYSDMLIEGFRCAYHKGLCLIEQIKAGAQ